MDFFVQGVNVLKILVTAIGAGLGAWGVINLMEGYGNDNPGAKSQGIKHWGVINLMEGYGNDNPGAKSQGIKHLITS